MAKTSERKEAWMRLIVLIVTGVILYAWGYFILILAIVNWVYAVFSGKRLKELADLSEIWNTQNYMFVRYLSFGTNNRPFPFNSLTKDISKYEK